MQDDLPTNRKHTAKGPDMNTNESHKPASCRPSVAGKRTVHGERTVVDYSRASYAGKRSTIGHGHDDAKRSSCPVETKVRPEGKPASGTNADLDGRGANAQRYSTDRYPGRSPSPNRSKRRTPSVGYEPLFEGSAEGIGRAIRRRRSLARIGIAAALIAVVVGGAAFAAGNAPITVSVNGTSMEVAGDKTVQTAFESAGEPAKAGNLVDVEGSTLEEGKGYRFSFAVNGQPGTDPETKLHEGDAVVFSDGGNIEEEADVSEEAIPFEVTDKGHGPIHVVENAGSDGVKTTKTGKISGKVVTQTTAEPQNRLYRRYYPDTNGEKVIALTFDDGPWDTYTAEILDILKENDAKATFFTVGNRITNDGAELVKREAAEGHQVCTHTWSHAAGSGKGVNLTFMSKDEQREEVAKGMKAISDATGNEASTILRAPGGNFPTEVWRNLDDLITAEIGWSVDTQDWTRPGSGPVEHALKNVAPGDVVLMHDGGGDRSQTVDALREALPYLKKQGYSFVTIDELMKYPMKNL